MRAALVGLGVLLPAAALLAAQAAAPVQEPRQTFRAGARTVAVYATVQDRAGRLVPNLTSADFQVLDEGTPVELTVFSNDPQDITVALLLDMSVSVADEFTRLRDAARHFSTSSGRPTGYASAPSGPKSRSVRGSRATGRSSCASSTRNCGRAAGHPSTRPSMPP